MVDPESCCVIYDLSIEQLQDIAFCDSYVRTLQCEVHRMDKDDDQDDWTYSPDLESCMQSDHRQDHDQFHYGQRRWPAPRAQRTQGFIC